MSVGDGGVAPVTNVGLFSRQTSALSRSVNVSFVPGCGAYPPAGFTCGWVRGQEPHFWLPE